AALLPIVITLLWMSDIRNELAPGGDLVLPLLCWAICVLAASPAAVQALGVTAAWGRAVRWGALAVAGGVALWIGWCNLQRETWAPEAMAALHAGMSWHEVVLGAGAICPMSRAEVMDGVMWLRCRPTAPPACDCAPVVDTGIALRFRDDRL